MKSLLPALAGLMLVTSVHAQTSTGQTPKPISMPTAPVPGARPDPDTLRDPAAADAIKAAERKAAQLQKEKLHQARKKVKDDEALAAADARSGKAKARAQAEVEDERAMTRAERRAARKADQQAANAAADEKKMTREERRAARKAAREARREASGDKAMMRAERRAARKVGREEADKAQALTREERRAARRQARAEARAARLAAKPVRAEVILPTPVKKALPGVNDGSRP